MSLKSRLELAMRRRGNPKKAALARAAKVSSASVADWFNGKTHSLKADTARLAAEFLGCDRDWLGSGTGAPNWTDPEPGDEAQQVAEETMVYAVENAPPAEMPAASGALTALTREATSLALLFDGLPETFLDGSTKREFFVRLVGLIQERPHLQASAAPVPAPEPSAAPTGDPGKRRGATHAR
ncbi:MAG TPA: helix-turn-helix domain-containing protein [Ramlibacter sp.]|nr:helix-turn-helix domain-containing protein [Candidatus Limnocylindrales bacterium]HYF41597.1 helix-turn-helix domain-containing protein [Ramlibacter sp.]